MRIVSIIQARLGSLRLPRKVLMRVGKRRMLQWVINASRDSYVDKTVVAWAERFPHLEERDVLNRYREVAVKENAGVIVRLTSDCPLLRPDIINVALAEFARLNEQGLPYYNNRDHGEIDGHDVQICTIDYLLNPKYHYLLDNEHVFRPEPIKVSVDTNYDLEVVRAINSNTW